VYDTKHGLQRQGRGKEGGEVRLGDRNGSTVIGGGAARRGGKEYVYEDLRILGWEFTGTERLWRS